LSLGSEKGMRHLYQLVSTLRGLKCKRKFASICQDKRLSGNKRVSLFWEKWVTIKHWVLLELLFKFWQNKLLSRFAQLGMSMKRSDTLLLLLACCSVRCRHLRFWKLMTRAILLNRGTQIWVCPRQYLTSMRPFIQPEKMQSVSCLCQRTLWMLWVSLLAVPIALVNVVSLSCCWSHTSFDQN